MGRESGGERETADNKAKGKKRETARRKRAQKLVAKVIVSRHIRPSL